MDQRKPVQMESLQSWFRREVYQWRVGASIVWTVLTIPPVVSLYFLLACFSPLHPVQWLMDFLSGLTSLAFWASMATLMCVVGGISVYNSAHFVVVPDIPLNRAAAIASLFRIPCVIHSAVFSLAGGVIIWCCSGLIGAQYDRLAEHCSEESEKYCLNERHLLMILQGVAVGVMCHLQYWLRHDNYITFPVLQQAKFFTVKSNIWSILSRSFYFELYFIKYFYLVYFILGHIPRNWILRNMNIESRDVQPLNTIFGLLDLGLLWEITLSGMFVHFLFTYSAFLYKVYISEPYVFPIENVYEESRNKCLHNALGCADFPLVKRLGYLDLSLLSRHSTGRRGQLFTLSQPGGHPHNWNSVYRACLTEVDALSHSLQENNWKTFAPLRHSSGENSANGVTGGVTNLTFRGPAAPITEVGPNQPAQPNTQVDPWAKMVSNLKTRPVFGYFLSELPEAAARRVFAASQTQIWAIEALSALVAASFTEDPYGVVQRSMPEILASLLNLQENVEKHFKLAPVVSRRSQSALDVGLRHALRTTLKMSLYRIINTFGSHLSELKLTPEHTKRLKFFMDYRE